ncbi:ABC transporter ATP-binding protein [Pseudovibrio sp. JE062]|uniref:ABC transporter ATP-binding protein n=1 Tax=Pseudovibrio sp. JE062 TaxID=439495 RepID=UPI000186C41C|nr:dipeptide/oligopeptide/nickel ABC transporter ATP-binding protein [Pseudovibrio sp. JE062]EEA94913.1 oligopeptide transport ATP-binding protein oppf [Pseudovibrio sp. JE062]
MTMEARHLSIAYGDNQVLSEVSLTLHPSRTTGLVGRSGCGKSTLAKAMTGIIPAPQDALFHNNQIFFPDLSKTGNIIHYMWQDPLAALSPFLNALDLICEPLKAIHKLPKAARHKQARGLLHMVGLEDTCAAKRPHQLSGGQCQRIALARALAVKPKFLVLDEPLSALDLVTQEQIASLLRKVRAEMNMGILIISHDLQTLAKLADDIAVMDGGRIVEHKATEEFFATPEHPLSRQFVEISRYSTPAA